jgi:hypothetical protein
VHIQDAHSVLTFSGVSEPPFYESANHVKTVLDRPGGSRGDFHKNFAQHHPESYLQTHPTFGFESPMVISPVGGLEALR